MVASSAQCYCCSKWGQNRVFEHRPQGTPLDLVLPVLTSADIVEKAVAGVLSGKIGLSMSTVEPCLVLANSIGVSHLLDGTATAILHILQLSALLPGVVSSITYG